MKRIGLLKNIVRDYSWGSYTAIPKLLGKKPPYQKPCAELWMGAHPSGSSIVKTGKGWESLYDLIREYPDQILGRTCSKKFGGELPFLFKIIAASKPLSIQIHPNLSQARKGFKRENSQDIPVDSFLRNYRDENHKPELLCALSSFEALCGFRKIKEILILFKKACPETLIKTVNALDRKPDSSGLKGFMANLMKTDANLKKKIISEAALNARKFAYDEPAFECVVRLIKTYPDDIGVLSPLYLNLVRLSPGQAIFLPAGLVHSYLEGTALELMAGSDNVIRGGLTQKHMDSVEFLKTAGFRSHKIKIIMPVKNRKEYLYRTSTGEFALSKIIVGSGSKYLSPKRRNAEIILCTEGRSIITGPEGAGINLSPGKSVIIPASVTIYSIDGKATLYKAQTPL